MRVPCILGPTGTGKSALALALAERFPIEIVSVDSAMIFRGMDIGTAKPSKEIRARVPHHLIDIVDAGDAYSAGRFRTDAARVIDEILSRGRIPLLVGGTLLYFRVLWRGLAEMPPADPATRSRIDRRAAELGWPALHRELQAIDPETASRVRPTDRQRIQRALEVHSLAGVPISHLRAGAAPPLPVDFLRIALVPRDRAALYAGLDLRLDRMLDEGLIDEVSRIRCAERVAPECQAMRAVGYRQFERFIAGECTREEALRAARSATHQLAKRQLTWLRSEPADFTFDPQTTAEMPSVIGSLFTGMGIAGRSRPMHDER